MSSVRERPICCFQTSPAGTTPPLTRLTLPEGTHTITVRNEDFPPFITTVQVTAEKPATVRHRFAP